MWEKENFTEVENNLLQQITYGMFEFVVKELTNNPLFLDSEEFVSTAVCEAISFHRLDIL